MRIPPNLEPAVLEEAGNGRTYREIASWLEATHAVKTSFQNVAKTIARIRAEREPVRHAVIAAKTAGSVGRDLDVLAELQTELNEKRKVLAKAPRRLRDYLAVVEELRKVTGTKLQAAGAGANMDPPPTEPRTRLLAVLERLANE